MGWPLRMFKEERYSRARLVAQLHEQTAQHVLAPAVTPIAPGVVVRGVLDELRVPRAEQQLGV